MVKYRILERRTDGDWTPFAVAYEREGRIVLFAPPWRAHRTLAATSLEELDVRHCPSDEFQWRGVEFTTEPVEHPIEWLQRALDATWAAAPMRSRLATALSWLAAARDDLRDRMMAWREQVEHGLIPAEATLRVVLAKGQAGMVEALTAMSHPSLSASYAGAGLTVKGDQIDRGPQAPRAVILTTDALANARIAVEGDAVVVTFLDWEAPSSPLVLLVPDAEQSEPRTPDLVEDENGAWVVRFTHVFPGTYLVVVALVSAEGGPHARPL